MKLIELVQLNEVAKPVLDISALERDHKKLPPKAKEVMPTNIKEWHNFQKQIDNLWAVYANYKAATLPIDVVPEADFYKTFLADVLQGLPYKHSLPEVASAISPAIADYLFHNGFDVHHYDRIRNFGIDLLRKSKTMSNQEKLKTSLTGSIPEIAINDLGKAMARLRTLNPSTIKLTPIGASRQTIIDVKHVHWLNSLSNLKLILGPVTGDYCIIFDELKATVDTLHTSVSLPQYYIGQDTINDGAIAFFKSNTNMAKEQITRFCSQANQLQVTIDTRAVTGIKVGKANGIDVVQAPNDPYIRLDISQFAAVLKSVSPKVVIR